MRWIVVACPVALFVWQCASGSYNTEAGKKLAGVYCNSCHIAPDPKELDKNTWLRGVLPEMGARLGIRSSGGIYYPQHGDTAFYPVQALLTPDEWDKIVNYYYYESPDSLALPKPVIARDLAMFTPAVPPGIDKPPTTTFIRIDPGNHAIYRADGENQKLESFNASLRITSEVATLQAVSDVAFNDLETPGNRRAMVLNMGKLKPTDVTNGSIQRAVFDRTGYLELSAHPILTHLPRPVNIQPADFNGDGREDYLICGYGNYTGSLFWLKNNGNDQFERIDIRSLPGSIQAVVRDFNNDKRPDIMALMAQGDEGVFLFEQQKDGTFSERRLLRFSPVNGSISIDIADFNKDGHPDIVYTCGDNADYSKVLKPYHGVYVFVNDGNWNMSQQYFFHINGCFRAIARDFDLDGDIDISAIAFFADFNSRPEEGFVFLRNEGNWNYSAHTLPGKPAGRWITQDVADLDGDGDDDIVLGNFSIGLFNSRPDTSWRSGPPFVLLKNNTR